MTRKRRNRRRNEQRPFRDIQLDLTIDMVMADLDSGWSPRTMEKSEGGRSSGRKAA